MRTITGETPVCATVSMKKENRGMFPMIGNQGELAGLKHMDELNATPSKPVDLLKLLRLLDFEALYAISPSNYTTEAFLKYYAQLFPDNTPTMMGTQFDGFLWMQSEIRNTRQPFGYPFHSVENQEEVCSNLATLAAIPQSPMYTPTCKGLCFQILNVTGNLYPKFINCLSG